MTKAYVFIKNILFDNILLLLLLIEIILYWDNIHKFIIIHID